MCDFPSKVLLQQMREAANLADASNDPARITYALGFVKAATDLRLYHEDLTGCACWYEALREMDAERLAA